MEKLEDGHYGLMSGPDSRPPVQSSTTFSADEESISVKEQHGVVTSSDLDDSPASVSQQSRWQAIMTDVLFLLLILFMVAWPWAIYGFFRSRDGVQMPSTDSAIVYSIFNGTILITFLGTLNRIIASYVFGHAIIRYGQERIAQNRRHLTVFGVSALLAFRHKSFMWSVEEWSMFRQGRRLAVVVSLAFSLAAFAVIPTGTTALLAPVLFTKNSPLKGSEVDLTTNDADCVSWLEKNTPSNFYGCQGNRRDCLQDAVISDAIYAGRKSMVFGSESDEGIPQQLMADQPVRFVGPLQGILPIGAVGFRGLKDLEGWDRPSTKYRPEWGNSYNLTQQGLESEVECFYDQESPIQYEQSPEGSTSSGLCDVAKGWEEVVPTGAAYPIPNPDLTWSLTSWVCRGSRSPSSNGTTDSSESDIYRYYLRGTSGYATSIGSITCNLSKLRFRDYEVSYNELGGYFTTINSTTPPSERRGGATAKFIDELVFQLSDLVWGAQTQSGHVVAESILDSGERLFNVSREAKNDRHLRLFEGFTRGALEFYATHSRLLISSRPYGTLPPNCNRVVDGSRTFEVFGWDPSVRGGQLLLLIPMTLMNLASLAIFVAAMIMGRFRYQHSTLQPMDTRSLLTAKVLSEDSRGGEHGGRRDPKEDWEKRVVFMQDV
ncbi:hypothetical protein MD484_g768, partial [Candolleomyces efflorescens]